MNTAPAALPAASPVRSVESLRSEIIAEQQYQQHLNATLSGCDWCCGGGDEILAASLDHQARLERALRSGWYPQPVAQHRHGWY